MYYYNIDKMKKLVLTICSVFAFATSAFSQREVVCLDNDWQFAFGDASNPAKDFGCGTEYFNYLTKANSIHNEGPYSEKFDASSWKHVNLPHDFVVDLPYDAPASHSHGYKQVGYKYPQTSVGWYRKSFRVDSTALGKHFQLSFDGIFRDSRVWVNGFYCGGEPSGYISQSYDITDYLNYGGDNLICVRTDATLEEGWFYEGAGIYRHAWLKETSPVHIAENGICITTHFPKENDKKYSNALVTVKTAVKNSSHDEAAFQVKVRILDKSGKEVAAYTEQGPLRNGKVKSQREATSRCQINVESPHLWDIDSPYLYTAEVSVLDNHGKVLDVQKEKFGIRDVKFHKDRGFILNGKVVKLHGVNLHQDHAGVGAGIPDAVLVYRIKKLKELGCNAYRSSHNPMSPAMLDVCDSLGIVVIDENRLSGISEYEIHQLKSMIERDRNHPSVILWSVGNEEWGIEWNVKGERIAATMRDYCHLFDPSREMTFATSSGPTVEVPVDVAGYNYITQNPIDEHRQKYPERKCVGTEELTGCGTRGCYYDDIENGHMMSENRKPDEKDGTFNLIERGWKFYAERPWAAGCFYWTGIDYRGEPNPLKYPATGSQKGILDYCAFPKDEAYYLQSWWTEKPVLHIFPHWNLKGHEGEAVDVWAYSNCDEVELFVNGKSVGRQQMPKNGHLSWKTTYQPGTLKAVGYTNGKKSITQVLETTSNAMAAKIKYYHNLANDGVSICDIDLVDKKGRFVPDACNDLLLTVPEGVEILGWGNGDPAFQLVERPTDSSAATMNIKAFNGKAQVIIKTVQSSSAPNISVKIQN